MGESRQGKCLSFQANQHRLNLERRAGSGATGVGVCAQVANNVMQGEAAPPETCFSARVDVSHSREGGRRWEMQAKGKRKACKIKTTICFNAFGQQKNEMNLSC